MTYDASTNNNDQSQVVLTEKRGTTFVVTINRPAVKNAIDRPTASALAQAFREFDDDETLAVAVLSGSGSTFCSGFDLKSVDDDARTLQVSEDGDGPLGVTRMLLSKPVIAAVEGYAVAGGLEVALWCDLRVAAENAVFGVFNRRWGVPLVDGGTIRLTRLIGQSHALDLILTGRGVSGQEALTIGLANRLVQPGETLAAALTLAEDLARFPQHGLRSDRLSVYEQWSLSWAQALGNETRRGLEVLHSGESVEGARRFAAGHGRHGSSRDI
ncbi:MAG TPA: crotonase/enoyl-CoA hydratase family protein [Ktedonobacteraceae bacterium]|jgi:enoyl-CoA hydratase|nr:crotonase/enoyl-CoA hydratase family protein [Ktedonobacteraceae bacterium]